MTHIVSPDERWNPSSGPLLHPALGSSGSPIGRFETRLARWAADAAHSEQAEARRQRHWLAIAANDAATLDGVLADLGERGAMVTVTVAGGATVRGTIRGIGVDFVLLATAVGPAGLAFVSRAHLLAVRTLPGERPTAGTQVLQLDMRMIEVLADLAPDRPRIQVVGAPEAPSGELRAVGRDVLTLRADGTPPATVYLPVGAMPGLLVS
jgi:hypothetical protein